MGIPEYSSMFFSDLMNIIINNEYPREKEIYESLHERFIGLFGRGIQGYTQYQIHSSGNPRLGSLSRVKFGAFTNFYGKVFI